MELNWGTIAKIIEGNGVTIIMFIVWLVYHSAQVRTYEKILNEQAEREKRNFDLLENMIERDEYKTAVLCRIETKIDGNQFCPLMHKENLK